MSDASNREGDPRVIVVGGGIGGLAAAIALRNAGLPVVAFERAADLKRVEVGAGMTLWSNAIVVLDRLGVGEEVRARGRELDVLEQRTSKGRQISSWPLAEMGARLGAPTIGIARPTLHAVLAAEAGDVVVPASECTEFIEDDSGVRAILVDGRIEAGGILVGADGINSRTRRQLLGEHPPRFSGLSMWRASIDIDPADVSPVPFGALWGPGRKFVWFQTAAHELSWEAIFSTAAPGGTDPQGARKRAALEHFGDWADPTRQIVEATSEEAISRADVLDLRPLESWGSARVTLLGDAAHAMTFAVGQGAAQALEDAVALASLLRDASTPEQALREYERQRKDRAAHFQALAWRLARVGRLKSRPACAIRSAGLAAASRLATRAQEKDMVIPPIEPAP